MELLKPNHTQIPNVFFDKLMYRLGDAEWRVLLYICRRTYGFQRESDRIAFSQFIDGLVKGDGERLDGGCGLSRPSVSKGLKTLMEIDLILCLQTSKGNVYKINTECDLKLAVNKLNQLSNLTKTGKEGEPKVVKLLNTQKKGKERKESSFQKNLKSPEIYTPERLEEVLVDMEKNEGSYLDIIATFIRGKGVKIENSKQLDTVIRRYAKVAKSVEGAYTNKQLWEAIAKLKTYNRRKDDPVDWTLETMIKQLTK